jgi:hypothetical protein
MARTLATATCLALLTAAAATSASTNRTVIFLEQYFMPSSDPSLARAVNLSSAHGGSAFQVLSLMTWDGDFSPNETAPLPAADAGTVSVLQAARAASPSPLRIWGGVSLCPGPAYSCMLNATQANLTGTQLAQRVADAGLQGVIIYVSPYCNNANCKKETGKYAEGIATIVAAFKAAAPAGVEIALPLNEWDNPQIVAARGPATILSWQTVFYFTSISDCQKDCGALCGAGENSAYVTRDKKNFTQILEFLAQSNVVWTGQFAGVSTPDEQNPPDFWTALEAYSSGAMPGGDGDNNEKAFAAAPPPPPAVRDEPYEATIWLYAPSADNATWAGWFDTFTAYRANVTGVSPCTYLVDDYGNLTTQMNASWTELTRDYSSRMANELGLRVRPLIAASGVGINLMIKDPALASTFINATLDEATALNYSGYNVQLEEPGNATIAVEWLAFLGEWLDAAATRGLTISMITGSNCRGKDWMFVECGDYKLLAEGGNGKPPRPNLRIIPEYTYTREPSAWQDYLANLVRGLGTPLLAPGMTYGPPLDNPANGCLPAAATAGVRELYVWVNPPSGDNATVAQQWAALGWWVAGAKGGE